LVIRAALHFLNRKLLAGGSAASGCHKFSLGQEADCLGLFTAAVSPAMVVPVMMAVVVVVLLLLPRIRPGVVG